MQNSKPDSAQPTASQQPAPACPAPEQLDEAQQPALEEQSATKQALLETIETLKAEIAEVLLEIDHINLQVNPHIVAEYRVKIGCWENELLRAQIAARRARRKCELAQAAANKREVVDEALCNQILDAEFTQWEQVLAQQVEQLRTALELRANAVPLSATEARELKSLHRTLVKRLHPDTHPSQTEEASSFFALAQRAYEFGDLDMLRAVEAATSSYDQAESDAANKSETELYLEIDLLEAQLGHNKKQLAALKAQNPYALGAKIFDDEWVNNTVASLKASIEEQKAIASDYEKRFAALREEGERDVA